MSQAFSTPFDASPAEVYHSQYANAEVINIQFEYK